MKVKDKKSGLSESFITGVIAIVFLIVGFQTALFIHRASVMKIVGNRDEPDTVYVYASAEKQEKSSESSEFRPDSVVKRKSSHSPRAETVRRNAPRKSVENFMFNPNTVSIEDLCRLGFSVKQAQSIENYRRKGGRFRRKTDFARSFVVSDSIYRRLEPYIDIPLTDLNEADSAAFDALPGIGGWFASKIIEHRNALGGFSYKEQLMDIYRFDEEKYKALEDLVTINPQNVRPYPLWTLPADSLRLHPYISNYETARSIILFRDNSPKSSWTVTELASSGILSPLDAARLSRCAIAAP